jgi:hypothetical protein
MPTFHSNEFVPILFHCGGISQTHQKCSDHVMLALPRYLLLIKAGGSLRRTSRSILAGIVLIACCRFTYSQFYLEPTPEPVAVPPPMQLFQDLTACNGYSGSCDEKSAEKQTAALSALGIPTKSADDARLLFEDLDGDQKAEALLTVEYGGADVVLIVLKEKGDQWYRLPPQEEFSCWCRYESAPLDTFVEVVDWSNSFEKTSQPRKLLLVRGSGGGTGLYERGLGVFALDGFRVRPVFGTTEERRECPWPEGDCKLDHAIITFRTRGEPHLLITNKIHVLMRPDELRDVESWWVGIPPSSCQTYLWDSKGFKFIESRTANIDHCRPVKRPTVH